MVRLAGAVDYDNPDLPSTATATGPRGEVSPELQGRIQATEAGTTCEFELRATIANLALLRTLRIQLASPESLPELERSMSRDPDRGIDAQHELKIASFLHNALTVELRKSFDAAARGVGGGVEMEAARVEALRAAWVDGDAAMAAYSQALLQRLAANKGMPSATRVAASENDDEDSAASVLVGGGGGSHRRAGGKGNGSSSAKRRGGQRQVEARVVKPEEASPATASTSTTRDVEIAPAADSKGSVAVTGVQPPLRITSDHDYRLALAAHLRAVEQRVMSRQAGLLAEDIMVLTTQLESFDLDDAPEKAETEE